MAVPSRTIGQVLKMIREEFPDISVSKLRYLESEGLISPERDQPSGYRRFRPVDVDRLLYVLRTQRDQYLPLKVIRDHLEALDRGEEPSLADSGLTAPPSEPQTRPVGATSALASGSAPRLVTRRQLLVESGLGEATLIELERIRIIAPRRGGQLYGREAVALAAAAKRLGGLGVDPRQLRVVQQSAVAEAALVEQVLTGMGRRDRLSRQLVADVYRIVLQAHSALLYSQISD